MKLWKGSFFSIFLSYLVGTGYYYSKHFLFLFFIYFLWFVLYSLCEQNRFVISVFKTIKKTLRSMICRSLYGVNSRRRIRTTKMAQYYTFFLIFMKSKVYFVHINALSLISSGLLLRNVSEVRFSMFNVLARSVVLQNLFEENESLSVCKANWPTNFRIIHSIFFFSKISLLLLIQEKLSVFIFKYRGVSRTCSENKNCYAWKIKIFYT